MKLPRWARWPVPNNHMFWWQRNNLLEDVNNLPKAVSRYAVALWPEIEPSWSPSQLCHLASSLQTRPKTTPSLPLILWHGDRHMTALANFYFHKNYYIRSMCCGPSSTNQSVSESVYNYYRYLTKKNVLWNREIETILLTVWRESCSSADWHCPTDSELIFASDLNTRTRLIATPAL